MFSLFLILATYILVANCALDVQIITSFDNSKHKYTVNCEGGVKPYRYDMENLPPGAALWGDEIVVADNAVPGLYPIKLTVSDSQNQRVQKIINLDISKDNTSSSQSSKTTTKANKLETNDILMKPKSSNFTGSVNLGSTKTNVPLNSIKSSQAYIQTSGQKQNNAKTTQNTMQNNIPVKIVDSLINSQQSVISSKSTQNQAPSSTNQKEFIPQMNIMFATPLESLTVSEIANVASTKQSPALNSKNETLDSKLHELNSKINQLNTSLTSLLGEIDSLSNQQLPFIQLKNVTSKELAIIANKIRNLELLQNHTQLMIAAYSRKQEETKQRCNRIKAITNANSTNKISSRLPTSMQTNAQSECQSLLFSVQTTLNNYLKTQQNYMGQLTSTNQQASYVNKQLELADSTILEIQSTIAAKNTSKQAIQAEIQATNEQIQQISIRKQGEIKGGMYFVSSSETNLTKNINATESTNTSDKLSASQNSPIPTSMNPKITTTISDVVETVNYSVIHPFVFASQPIISSSPSIAVAYNLQLRRQQSPVLSQSDMCTQFQAKDSQFSTSNIKGVVTNLFNQTSTFTIQQPSGQLLVIKVLPCTSFSAGSRSYVFAIGTQVQLQTFCKTVSHVNKTYAVAVQCSDQTSAQSF